MPRKAKGDPPNPLPCGCAAMGRPTINWNGTRMEYLGTHVVHCPLHAAADDLLAALKAVVRVADRKTDVFDAAHAAIARADGPGVCTYCGEPKVDGPACHGNDQCVYGPDGGPALCCTGWSGMCCKCGASYAVGQM